MTRMEKPGMLPTPSGVFGQLLGLQGLAPGDPTVVSAARTVARLQALACDASKDHLFESEPTGVIGCSVLLREFPSPVTESGIAGLSLTEVAAKIAARGLSSN
jgi:hypothetical protein